MKIWLIFLPKCDWGSANNFFFNETSVSKVWFILDDQGPLLTIKSEFSFLVGENFMETYILCKLFLSSSDTSWH